MHHITAGTTCQRLAKIFIRLGFPRTITVDNGRQFVSKEFDDYCRVRGIHLNTTTPYWPQENGEVERQNRSVLKRLKISHALARDWRKDLQEYILMYNTTPHSTTGKTPTQLFFGRTIRGKIPSLADVETAPPNTDFADRDRILKEKGKESEDRKRRAGVGDITVGSRVVLKNVLPGNKFSPVFDSKIYEVLEKSGARLKLQEVLTGKVMYKNITHAKKVYTASEEDSDTPSEPPLQIENMIQGRAKTSSSSDFSRLSDNLTTPTFHESDADVFDSSKSQELQDASVVTLRPHRPARRPVKYQDYVL
uniref:Uncharacterized protein n=1 Tax=Phlebotomus papatasi TaxID=29031 RepID=A0A1B0DIP4_PHLPP